MATKHTAGRHFVHRRRAPYTLFDQDTRAIIYGLQPLAAQRMLDFDYVCKRERPSVAAMVVPTENQGLQKLYWGTSEIMIPLHTTIDDAIKQFPEVDVMINFASFRSVYSSTIEALNYSQIRTIAIIAEGVPERRSRMLIREAHERGVTIIGPATVGGIKPGCFRIGNTGGMLDNIIASRLYRPGSVAYVSRSGGLSNELNNIISRNSDGVYEGIAIGGDLYPGTTFLDHLLRYEADPAVKMMVFLGEVGGRDEYEVCTALKEGRLTKPLVAWCIGTCAKVFPSEVQFGHAGALARSESETADAKNAALREAGALVPQHFEDFGTLIHRTYRSLVEQGVITERPEPEPPKVPMDYAWAQKMGLIRKPSNFVCTISDDRGEELIYAGLPISQAFEEDIGIGGVLSLLWFKRLLPHYALKFIEMVLMVTADRDTAVSGIHNTTVTTGAGKDLVSALVAGLLTIGPRFGGSIEGAARDFAAAYDAGLTPQEFVNQMAQRGQRIQGIGYRKEAVQNSIQRVAILTLYARWHFPATDLLDYALEVERIMTRKRSNLILNIDGCMGVLFYDLLRSSGVFTPDEADECIQMGCLTGLFVLGRSIDFIGHFVDMNRLKSVAFVSQSSILSTELSAIISRNTDGVHDGVVIGGERYPHTSALEHLLRYEADPAVKMIVLVSDIEPGDECEICQALEDGRITKPLVLWSASVADRASAKESIQHIERQALRNAQIVVSDHFEDFERAINHTYRKLFEEGVITRQPEPGRTKVLDHRVEDLLYAGMPISKIFEQDIGIGGVLGLLWFKRLLPDYARTFIEMVLMVTADHGPAVSGSHNTIVAARAEKDLVSSIASGLLTIGPRFGGAIDGAAQIFAWAHDTGLSPHELVEEMKRRGQPIMGIGHRIKSVQNPDMRVTIIKAFARKHFPSTELLDYALEVEKLTTRKRSNLILNVDGCIAVCFVDLMRSCGAFIRQEADEYVQMGCLNGLFVLGRSIGLIGHYFDQKRLKQGLYRHPWDDIAYMLPDEVVFFDH